MRHIRRLSLIARRLSLIALGICLVHGSSAAQEMDNAVFHYSRLQVDASRTEGPAVGRWEGDGWIGTDFDRLWWQSSGERAGGSFGRIDATLLYGRYVRRFWDLVVGYRHDIEPTPQGYLGFGLMGLAPYWFETSLMGYVSQRGRPSLRFEADNDVFLTQRLLLRPSIHVDWLIAEDDRLDLAAGVRELELGARLRYEVRRKFAPYVDLTWVRENGTRTVLPGAVETEGVRFGAGLQLIY